MSILKAEDLLKISKEKNESMVQEAIEQKYKHRLWMSNLLYDDEKNLDKVLLCAASEGRKSTNIVGITVLSKRDSDSCSILKEMFDSYKNHMLQTRNVETFYNEYKDGIFFGKIIRCEITAKWQL